MSHIPDMFLVLMGGKEQQFSSGERGRRTFSGACSGYSFLEAFVGKGIATLDKTGTIFFPETADEADIPWIAAVGCTYVPLFSVRVFPASGDETVLPLFSAPTVETVLPLFEMGLDFLPSSFSSWRMRKETPISLSVINIQLFDIFSLREGLG